MPQFSRDIELAIVAEQARMGWPDRVPAWVEVPSAAGRILWHRYQNLTIALCLQAQEHQERKARRALERLVVWPSASTLRRIAHHVVRARLYACTYIQLVGQQGSTEDDVPFAHGWY